MTALGAGRPWELFPAAPAKGEARGLKKKTALGAGRPWELFPESQSVAESSRTAESSHPAAPAKGEAKVAKQSRKAKCNFPVDWGTCPVEGVNTADNSP